MLIFVQDREGIGKRCCYYWTTPGTKIRGSVIYLFIYLLLNYSCYELICIQNYAFEIGRAPYFLDTCRMGTPLRESKTQSICTNNIIRVTLSMIIIIVQAPFTWTSDELCNFLNNCRMATPLRGCQAPSICTNVLKLHPMGWSWRWSIQGSIINFTRTIYRELPWRAQDAPSLAPTGRSPHQRQAPAPPVR
jgi:hypothetical protein